MTTIRNAAAPPTTLALVNANASASPLLRHVQTINAAHPQALVLHRMGHFYEAFEEHARVLSRVCARPLQVRRFGDAQVVMAGIPMHALDVTAAALVAQGFTVVTAAPMPPRRP